MSPHLETLLLNYSWDTVVFGVNWMLQSTGLLAVGLSIGRLLSRRGSAVQSLVYRTTLAAVLICPLAASVVAGCGASGWSTGWQFRSSSVESVTQVQVLDPAGWETTSEESMAQPGDPRSADSVRPDIRSVSTDHISSVTEPSGMAWTGQAEQRAGLRHVFTAERVVLCLCMLWALVSGWLCILLIRAWAVIHSIRRSATPAPVSTIETCQRLSDELQVPMPAVRCSPFISSPCLTGIWYPIVLLPGGDPNRSAGNILIHELAHLKRRDVQWNLFRQLATAMFFFQPLLWKLSHRMEMTAEEVCDDFVVEHGGNRREYANLLVDVAESADVPLAPAAVAIVSPHSLLARRIARILDVSRDLSTSTSRLIVATTLSAGIAATTVLGMVSAGSSSAIVAVPTEAAPDEPAAPAAPAAIPDVGVVTVNGLVVDPAGHPLPNARIWLQRAFATSLVDETLYREYRDSLDPDWSEWFEVTSTNSEGDFSFDVHSAIWNVGHNPYATRIAATSDGFGFGMAAVPAVFDSKEQPKLTIRTVVDQPIEGRIVSSDGQPAAGTSIWLLHVRAPEEPSADDYIADALAGGSQFLSFDSPGKPMVCCG